MSRKELSNKYNSNNKGGDIVITQWVNVNDLIGSEVEITFMYQYKDKKYNTTKTVCYIGEGKAFTTTSATMSDIYNDLSKEENYILTVYVNTFHSDNYNRDIICYNVKHLGWLDD